MSVLPAQLEGSCGTVRRTAWSPALTYARKDRAEQERILAELTRGDNVLVYQAFNVVAKVADDRRGAIEIATLLTDPSRSPTIRAAAHSEVAHMQLAMGRWEAAKAALDWAEPPEVNPRWSALATRATLAVSSFLPVPPRELEELRNSLLNLDFPSICPSSSGPIFPCPATWGRVSRPYLAGLLSVRLDDYDAAERHASELEAYAAAPDTGRLSAEWAAMAHDRALSVRAHAARKAGRSRQALALLDEMEPERWWGALGDFAVLRSRALARYLRGELLQELGRDEEALIFYESLTGRVLLQVYLAPTHYRRGEIYERLGDPDEAARHYRRVIELWKDCDPELRPMVERAEQRLARLGSNSS